MDLSLVMFTQKGERRDFPIRGRRATIGRTTECQIQIELPMVSRRHCELRIKDDLVFVRDLGSSNGTYVNNKRIQEAGLHPGDTLSVGPVVFTVVIDGEPANVQPVQTVLEPAPAKESKQRPRPQPVANDESGSLDLDDSSALNLIDDDDEDSPNDPVAALEALSKQKKD